MADAKPIKPTLTFQFSGPPKDLTGQIFGRFTVISFAGRDVERHNIYWRCQCSCGAVRIVQDHLHQRALEIVR